MPGQKSVSLYQQQKAVKPKPEDVANSFLDAEKAAAFLIIIEFIRANKINIAWVAGNSWGLNYRGKRMAFLKIHEGNWFFCQQPRHMQNYVDMDACELKNFVFENIYVKTCDGGDCRYNNPNNLKADYFDADVCKCWPLRIFNADGERLEQTKKLIEYSKNCILMIKEYNNV